MPAESEESFAGTDIFASRYALRGDPPDSEQDFDSLGWTLLWAFDGLRWPSVAKRRHFADAFQDVRSRLRCMERRAEANE